MSGEAEGEVRLLEPGDEGALFAFIEPRLDSSLFLASNSAKAGLVDRGEPLQGTYAGHFQSGALTAVAAHYWNGMLVAQGDVGLEAAAEFAAERSGRSVAGLIGPRALTARLRARPLLAGRRARSEKADLLYALDLAELRVPKLIEQPNIVFRAPRADEVLTPLTRWRVAYLVECFATPDSVELERTAQAEIEQLRRVGECWVLCDADRPVAFTAFNARTHGIVQVGGVWTPPELRGRGYARAAVAASLVEARRGGATRSVLFTWEGNAAARRAYEALGYAVVGEFSLVFFE